MEPKNEKPFHADVPEPIRDQFEDLWEDVASLHYKWKLYVDIFGDEEHIKVINATVPSAFQLIEESLRSDMIMSIGRLMDPAKTGPNANMSIERFIQSLADYTEPAFLTSVEARFQVARDHCSALLNWRNKRIGHNDLNTALKYHENPLPNITKPYVDRALKLISDLINSVQDNFRGGITLFDSPVQHGTGKDLVLFLRHVLEQRASELRRLRGNP
jgi:hypothetical protein